MSKERVIRLINQNDTMTAAAVLADDLGLDYNVASKIVQAYARGAKTELNRAYIGAEDSSEKPKGKQSKKNKQNSGATIEGIIRKYRNIWQNDYEGEFFAVSPVSEKLSGEARAHFSMERDESVAFYYQDYGIFAGQRSLTAITDKGIYGQLTEDDQLLFIPWADVKEVQYKEYNLDFFDYEGEYWHWDIGMFTENRTPDQGKKLAKVFNECAQAVAQAVNPYEEILQLENDEKFDDALKLIEQSVAEGTIEADYQYHFLKGRILVKKEGSLDEHTDEREKLIEKEFLKTVELTEDDKFVSYCHYWLAYLYHYTGQPYNARNMFILAMDSESEEMRDDSKEMLDFEEESLSELWDNYTSTYEYKDRKFLMPIKDSQIAGCIESGIDTFRLSNIPSCMKFPTGHPVANELYIGHPYNPNLYVPYSESEDIFFQDKIDELIYLLQCLGAEEIEITSIKGKSVSELENRSGKVSGHVDTLTFEGSGSYAKDSKRNQNIDAQLQRSFRIKCDPMKYPYIPEGLIWYGEQTRWQRMVEGRLNGNRLEYSESISSTDTRFVSNTEKKDIKAAAERLWIQVDGSAESNLETQFKEHTETQWRVDVRFRSLRDFTDENSSNHEASQLTTSEQEYLDEFKATQEDGEIGPRERKSLERARVRLGISEARAAEIEASVSAPKLTDEENAYLAEVKAVLEDGEIGPRERKSLERVRTRLGISEERAKEIELM